jgi:hypothetical protein
MVVNGKGEGEGSEAMKEVLIDEHLKEFKVILKRADGVSGQTLQGV